MPTHLVDLKNQAVGDKSICQTFTGTTAGHEGDYVDLQTADGPVFGVLVTGSVTGSGATLTGKLQECATTDGTYTDCTNGAFTVYTESTGDNILEFVNARRTARYVRAHLVIAATTSVTSAPVAIAVFGQKKVLGGDGSQTT